MPPMPCLDRSDCPETRVCVRTVCVEPKDAWRGDSPSVGLQLGSIEGRCRGAALTATKVRDRLAELLAYQGIAALEHAPSLQARRAATAGTDAATAPPDAAIDDLRGDLLGDLESAMESRLRAVVRIHVRCAPQGTARLVHLATRDLALLRDLPALRTELHLPGADLPTHLPRLEDLANRLAAVEGAPPGILGSRIAVTCQLSRRIKEIFSLEFRGGELRRETHHRNLTLLPAWTPDGRVAATSYVHDNPDILIGKRRFVKRPGLNTGITFHRESGRFALASEHDGAQDIFYGDSQTGRILERLTTDPGIDTSPDFSPSGQALVFVSDRLGTPQIYALNIPRRIERRISYAGGYNSAPAWSPDGRTLAWSRRRGGTTNDIVLADAADPQGTEHAITFGPASYEDPDFSPDGRYLVAAEIHRYRHDDDGASPVVIDLDTLEMWPLPRVPLPGPCSQPSWGPVPDLRRR